MHDEYHKIKAEYKRKKTAKDDEKKNYNNKIIYQTTVFLAKF
jgi:hypothetical protein